MTINEVSKFETKCTGCGACVNVCPRDAIRLKPRNRYFIFPVIDEVKCINCGLCLSKCPVSGRIACDNHDMTPDAYAVYGCNELRQKSSSGGFFSILARYVLANGGIVCGAAFDDNMVVRHIMVSNEVDLSRLRGSKYVQSDTGIIYRHVCEVLHSGKMVLFSGTPCQVAALKSIVGQEANNLITVDFFCHGVPPLNLFHQYLKEISGVELNSIKRFYFRDKRADGWKRFHIVCEYEGGRYDKVWAEDNYMQAFDRNLIIRRSCGNCRFARRPRQGDFTIGDLWGVAERKLNINDDKGVSAVLVNSFRAKKIFSELRKELVYRKKIDFNLVVSSNNVLSHSWLHPNAARFWEKIVQLQGDVSVSSLMQEYLQKNDGIAIMNFHRSPDNYGSVLTGYALQEAIKKIAGFTPVHIRHWSNDGSGYDMSDLYDFACENFAETPPCLDFNQLRQMNLYFRTFIVGPDVVWRNINVVSDFHNLLFDFVSLSKNICSYAASFGKETVLDKLIGKVAEDVAPSKEEIVVRKRLMKRFTHISVREDSGVDICKKIFDVQAEHVLDSVLLLREREWKDRLIQATGSYYNDNCSNITTYVLNPSYMDNALRTRIWSTPGVSHLREGDDYARIFDSEIKHVGVRIWDWIKGIASCSYLVTDSFHGACFGIVFRKQLILVPPSEWAGRERQYSLMRMLGMENRFAESVEDYERLMKTPINYEKIGQRLEEWITRSEDYLRRVIADNKPDKTRDWLESLEILIQNNHPPSKVSRWTLKRIIKGIARRFVRYRVIKAESSNKIRKFRIFGIPIATICWENNRRVMRLLFLRIQI